MDFAKDSKRLQKLSCISLTPEQEQKFWAQLNDIIGFLGQLPQTKDHTPSNDNKKNLTLKTIQGAHQCVDTQKILKNVQHEIVNNSIVIKSVLN